jgi:urease accessory protein
MTWHATLSLDYSLENSRSVARYLHDGPLRVLQSLYPDGDAICHNVLIHPPGGLVGGDTLDIRVSVASGAHGLITTPGATRFYRSDDKRAAQRTQLKLASGARLEWLPMETILHPGCIAENKFRFDLDPGAEMIGWDITALGLPSADEPFDRGSFCQHIEMPGVWLERGVIDSRDMRLMDSPLGLAGNKCIASLFFACGTAINRERRELALDSARGLIEQHTLIATAGATAPNANVIVLRTLAPHVEPVMDLFRKVWAVWRKTLWDIETKYADPLGRN